jgi:hypothetical protein
MLVDAGKKLGIQTSFSPSKLPETMVSCVRLKRICRFVLQLTVKLGPQKMDWIILSINL